MSDAELILNCFRGRSNYVAVCDDGKTFHPAELKEPLKASWLESEHLSGKRCLGFYLMTADNGVFCTCVDFDNKEEHPDPQWRDKAESVYYLLANAGLSPCVEISASGRAAHVWLFLERETEAWIPRAFWKGVSARLNIAMPEVYPRQERLSGKGIGNLVRYPLWNQSRFVDIEAEWQEISVESALSVNRTSGPDLKMLAFDLGFGTLQPETSVTADASGLPARVKDRISRHASLIAKRWNGDMSGLKDPSRSALCQSIACELVRTYVPTTEIEAALRIWCREHDYDKGEREGWISDTVAKAYDFVLSRTEKKSVSVGTVKDACHEYLSQLEKGETIVVPSGLGELDYSIGGVGFGEMAVVAARPSHGKSAFALQWADQAASLGVSSLLISEEMGKLEIGKRALLSISEFNELEWKERMSVMRGDVDEHYAKREPIHLVESCNTVDRAEELIDQYCAIYGVRLVVVDYLQLLSCRGQGRYETVTEVSQRLKKAARRNDCAMLALCQLNREIEKRDNWSPKLSDLRESGQIEQDADLVLFLQWPLRSNAKTKDKHGNDVQVDPNEYRIWCAKRRNGAIKSPLVTVRFNPDRQQFDGSIRNAANYVSEFGDWNDGKSAASGD
jgi:replicative DNA helicase